MKRSLSLLFLFLIVSFRLKATHNRAGEITYRQISGFQYEFTITTYSKSSSMADRNELSLHMGNGDSMLLPRVNGGGKGVPIANDIKKNIYVGKYTYSGAGRYWVWMQDPNRNASILNIPQSVNVPFYLRSLLVINPLLGTNNSPVLLNPPIDNACVFKCFEHNPGAYDPDGDSLSYKLVPCLTDGNPIPGYTYPDPGSGGIRVLDAHKGDFLWCTPQKIGEYNIAILIEEWRDGYLIGSVLRDMQITAASCKNEAPVIKDMNDTCVLAGSTLNIPVTAIDPDSMDKVTLIATGGPFLEIPKAQFDTAKGNDTVTSIFRWQTSCNQVQKQPFQVTFKATDSHVNQNLVDFETWNITVVGPAPQNPSATPSGSGLILNWEQSTCSQASCYKIYRHNGSTGWKHGPCETGVPAYTGYSLIGTVSGLTTTSYVDNNNGLGLVHGVDYCYMVVACYPDGSESYASEEFCGKLVRDVPIIINVSVLSTGTSDSLYVRWLKPVASPNNFDTSKVSGPYEFRLMQAENFPGNNSFSQIASFSSPYFKSLVDTEFVSKGLNTKDKPYSYKVEFYANGVLVGNTAPVSSVYLNIAPADNKLHLSWQEVVPWSNYKYYVYKKSPSGTFALLDSTVKAFYTDTGLVNGRTYCYYITTVGAYSDLSLFAPLYNNSQEYCAAPVDIVPPCAPELKAQGDCKLVENNLTWTNPNNSCSDDALFYRIYYTPIKGEPYHLLITTPSIDDTTYLHTNLTSIAGCYVITAVDSFMNESEYSQEVCVDNCPLYELPNVFTPNGDGKNDFFVPFPYKFVKDIELKIYNRWGQIMFETTDPNIKWDGRNKESKQMCSPGTYYYTCTVNEIRVTGIEARVLKGFIQLIEGKNPGTNN